MFEAVTIKNLIIQKLIYKKKIHARTAVLDPEPSSKWRWTISSFEIKWDTWN